MFFLFCLRTLPQADPIDLDLDVFRETLHLGVIKGPSVWYSLSGIRRLQVLTRFDSSASFSHENFWPVACRASIVSIWMHGRSGVNEAHGRFHDRHVTLHQKFKAAAWSFRRRIFQTQRCTLRPPREPLR